MQTDKVEESLKLKHGFIPKQAFSFLKYMMRDSKVDPKSNKTMREDEREIRWNRELGELQSKNAIMSNDVLKMRERLRPMSNAGFNYSDRKTAKGTKIWVKSGRQGTD